MTQVEMCPACRQPARRDKTLWSTNRPPVHVYVCGSCHHIFLVHEHGPQVADMAVRLPIAAFT